MGYVSSSISGTSPRVADKSHCRLTVSCTVTADEGGWCCGGGCPHPSPCSLVSEQVIPGFLCPLHNIFNPFARTGIYCMCGINSARYFNTLQNAMICGRTQTLCCLNVWLLSDAMRAKGLTIALHAL